jgi:mycothiol system anti-sigma-R factor
MNQLDCKAFEHSLDAYLDGELDPSIRIEMELHLGVCSGCRGQREVAQTLRRRLQEGCATARAPEGLKARIWEELARIEAEDAAFDLERAALDSLGAEGSGPVPMVTAEMMAAALVGSLGEEGRGERRGVGQVVGWRRWGGWQGVSLSVVAVGLVGLSLWGLRVGEEREGKGVDEGRYLAGSVGSVAERRLEDEQALLEEGVDWHQRQLPLEVTGPYGDEVGLWFRGKVDFQVRVPRFIRKDITLMGGRLAHLQNRRVALLTLAVKQQKVSLLVAPRQVMRRGGQQGVEVAPQGGGRRVLRQLSGYSVAMVQEGDLVYVIAADLPAKELEQLILLGFEAAEGGSR